MTVGVPGAGIGGLFYVANALLLPFRGMVRRARGESVAWSAILGQTGMAIGILLGIWATGWLLGLWLGSGVRFPAHPGLPPTGARTARLLGGATILVSVGTLGAVLLSVQLARAVLRRKA